MIKALELGKRYGRHWVFDLELDGGSAAVVEPNGSVETTLLEILVLLIEPDKGAPLGLSLRRGR